MQMDQRMPTSFSLFHVASFYCRPMFFHAWIFGHPRLYVLPRDTATFSIEPKYYGGRNFRHRMVFHAINRTWVCDVNMAAVKKFPTIHIFYTHFLWRGDFSALRMPYSCYIETFIDSAPNWSFLLLDTKLRHLGLVKFAADGSGRQHAVLERLPSVHSYQ